MQEEFAPFFKEFLRRRAAKEHFSKMSMEEKRMLVHLWEEAMYVSDAQLRRARKSSIYRDIEKGVKHSFMVGRIDHELESIFEKQRGKSIKRIEEALEEILKLISEEQYENIVRLREKPDSSEPIDRIIQDRLAHFPDRNLVKLWRNFQDLKKTFEEGEIDFPFTQYDLDEGLECASWDRASHIAWRIYQPEWRFWGLYLNLQLHIRQLPVEAKWALSSLPWTRAAEFLREIDTVDKAEEFLRKKYRKRQWVEELKERWLMHPSIGLRRRFLEQALSNHLAGHYAASMNLLLPLIEGVLWETAVSLHKGGKITVFSDEPGFFKPMLNRAGEEIPRQHAGVRSLVQQTELGDYVDKNFISRFCEQFYPDIRTPILHGQVINYDTELNSCKALATLEYLAEMLAPIMAEAFEEYVQERQVKQK